MRVVCCELSEEHETIQNLQSEKTELLLEMIQNKRKGKEEADNDPRPKNMTQTAHSSVYRIQARVYLTALQKLPTASMNINISPKPSFSQAVNIYAGRLKEKT